jgi:hypothetical protein
MLRVFRFALAVAACTGTAALGQDAPTPGMAYQSLSDLPEFTGIWLPEIYPFFDDAPTTGQQPPPAELTPDAAARARAYREAMSTGAAVERRYCAPQAFSGRLPMNVGGAMEVLFNPGRVTIGTEAGLVRRIYLTRTRDAVLEETRSGTSVGRWEGTVLVVETTGISPGTWFLGGVPVGRGARAVERFSLDGPDRLLVETTLTAPELLSAPATMVNRYRRARGRTFTEFDTCPGFDRSFDEASRLEQFDATPPADLPPPPAD